jgi:MiaB-like tRNA modifying enzyme
MKAFVEAYGCTLNFGESREIEDLLVSRGWEIVDSPDQCDLAVLATCVVIETTERAMLKRIRELSDVPKLVVTGCMATACREKAERIAPNALFVAPGELGSFSELTEPENARMATGRVEREGYGIVPIASGCLGSCAYCITRIARGQLKSRPLSKTVESVRTMVSDRPREIQLTAQDTAAYGTDIGTDLPSLVQEICDIPHDFRLRVGMMNPKSVLPLVEEISEMYLEPKVFKFLHLPIQSASDRLLEHMERGYTLDEYCSIVEKVREKIPDVTLSTDIIVGYPAESLEDHRLNLDFISDLRPDIVNVTRFSARPGTKAAVSKPQVVGWRAKDRSREITELRFKIALEKNNSLVGRRLRALSTERGKSGSTILRTDEYKQVVVHSDLELGRYYNLEITGATPTYLTGRTDGAQ